VSTRRFPQFVFGGRCSVSAEKPRRRQSAALRIEEGRSKTAPLQSDGVSRTASCILALAAALAALSPAPAAPPPADLDAGFREPPAVARPRTLWFWMNGHVTRDGITRDLEAMRRVGLGGALMFDGGTYLPAGPAGYLEPAWREAVAHAVRECARLGLEFGLHNAPGWSSTGGPWITPERAMQQLVWTETTVRGPGRVDLPLPPPQTNLGHYRDAFVLAFPAAPGDEQPLPAAIRRLATGTGQTLDPAMLSDARLDTFVAVSPQNFLQFEFAEPFEARAITVNTGPDGRFPRVALEASDDGTNYRPVTTVGNPGRHGIAAPGSRNFAAVRARFFRVVPSGAGELGEVVLHRTPRIADWVFKANFSYRVGNQVQLPAAGDADAAAIDPAQVRDLTPLLDAAGRLRWDAPPGAWTILRLGHTPTGQRNVSASAAGSGLECDKFSPAAVDFHFDHVIARILADAGPAAARSFTTVEIDSYETGMQNWTAAFPEEFHRRAGYDLRGWLPAMTGRVVGDAARSERFLFDLRRTQADLMAEAYYGRMAGRCRERGLRLYVEGYGQGVFDELQVGGVPDVPMTEFWTRTPWTPSRVVKMVASAAHTYGKAIVACEAFTGEEQTSRWLDYPYALKTLGDDMLALGVNQMWFHRFAHQPHPDAAPGMTMGPWGFHFDRTNTWFEHSRPWLDTLARSQFLLQQGAAVADVLYFVGERPPDVAQFAMPVLPAGCNFDLVNADVLLTRARVEAGRLVLPGGGSYRLLMLPPNLQGMTPALLAKLRDLVRQGATLLGPKPEFSLTLRGFPESEAELRRVAAELWDVNPPPGAGRVFAGRPVADVLRELGVAPDFTFTGRAPDAALSWTHRRLPDADVYFVANRQRRAEDVVCTFRVAGRQPELWHPETGERKTAAVFAADGDHTRVPLHLGPAESVFVVFRHPVAGAPAQALTRDGQPVLATTPPPRAPAPEAARSFTMAVWAKPDIDLRLLPRESTTGRLDETGKFYVICADEGDRRFGAGHATAGLAVGRNGAFVIERSRTAAPAVLVAPLPVAGWTHFAVVYRDGRPSLFVNGRHVRDGLVSGSVVHPGIGAPPPAPETVYHFSGLDNLTRASGLPPPPSQGRAFYFEGNLTAPELFDRALADTDLAALVARGLPPPEEPTAAELSARSDGKVDALVWRSGTYALDGRPAVKVAVSAPLPVAGPWRVTFPADRGAPEGITLPELISLHTHAEPGVRHFSGPVTYARALEVPAEFLAAGRRVVLDLGRVEVVASVRLNGREFDPLWKEPFRVDVTDAVRPGANELVVRVTTLWTNRLIGDESLPVEHEYGAGGGRGIRQLPEWYLKGEPKPAGGRTTFATWQFYGKDDPLVAAGLLGPVRLLNPVSVVLVQ
jgi:hypothetical protein